MSIILKVMQQFSTVGLLVLMAMELMSSSIISWFRATAVRPYLIILSLQSTERLEVLVDQVMGLCSINGMSEDFGL